MSRVAANTISHTLWHRTVLAIAIVAFPAAMFANIPSALQQPASETCYCHCHEAAARRGCTKMCDIGRHAAAWLASSCVKPRFQPPHDNSGVGPHFRQSPRAEHAEVLKEFSVGKARRPDLANYVITASITNSGLLHYSKLLGGRNGKS